MPAAIDFDLDDRELKRYVKQSPVDVLAAVEEGRRAGLQMIEDKLREQAPERTGALKRSIRLTTQAAKVGRKSLPYTWYTNRKPVNWLQLMRNKQYKGFRAKVFETAQAPLRRLLK